MVSLDWPVESAGNIPCREVENFPDGEKQEMMEIYEHKYGFSREDAQTMVDISFKYKVLCLI